MQVSEKKRSKDSLREDSLLSNGEYNPSSVLEREREKLKAIHEEYEKKQKVLETLLAE